MTTKEFSNFCIGLQIRNEWSATRMHIDKIIDNEYGVSFHIKIYDTPYRYNFWYCKLRKNVTISMYDSSLNFEAIRLKNIICTNNMAEFEFKVLELLNLKTK